MRKIEQLVVALAEKKVTDNNKRKAVRQSLKDLNLDGTGTNAKRLTEIETAITTIKKSLVDILTEVGDD